MEPATPTETLARLVRQKRRLLEQLASLAQRQGESLSEGAAGELLRLLAAKEQLIAGLRMVERGLDAFREQDPDTRPWPSPAARAACAADADECNRLLAEIVAAEERHAGEATRRRDEIAAQLRIAQTAHAASAAYKPHLRGAAALAEDATELAPLSASLDLTSQG